MTDDGSDYDTDYNHDDNDQYNFDNFTQKLFCNYNTISRLFFFQELNSLTRQWNWIIHFPRRSLQLSTI